MWWRASFDQPVPAGRLADSSSLSDLASVSLMRLKCMYYILTETFILECFGFVVSMAKMKWRFWGKFVWFSRVEISCERGLMWFETFRAVLLIFCGVIPVDWYLVADVSNDPDDESITIIFNIGNYLSVDTTWYRRSLESSAVGWCIPQPIDWHGLWFIRDASNGVSLTAVAATDPVMCLCRTRYGVLLINS